MSNSCRATVVQIENNALESLLRHFSAPENNEILNLWRDFLKVVDFIDDNHEWLNPLLAQTDKMKQ